MKRTLRRLNRALTEPAFRAGWIANLSQCYMDTEDSYRKEFNKKYLNRTERKIVARRAASLFLRLLKG